MPPTQTLLDLLHATPSAPALSDSALLIVDAQREYVDGSVPLFRIQDALAELKQLLERARKLGIPIFHVVHHAIPGAPIFDPAKEFVEIAKPVEPVESEPVIIKHHPGSFVETNLEELIRQTGKTNLVIGGFMTHMCINATARNANDLGFAPTIVASACTTRDLPSVDGGVITAQSVHDSNLASLADLVAKIVSSPSDLRD